MKKEYLGDAVFAEFDGYMLTLHTSNGLRVTNTIHLEPEVWLALVAFMSRPKDPPAAGAADADGGGL